MVKLGTSPILDDLLQRNGRLKFEDLCKLVLNQTREDFLEQFHWPVFLGKTLFEGSLNDASQLGSTMVFEKETFTEEEIEAAKKEGKVEAELEKAGLSRAIYLLSQQPESFSPPGIINVGRVAENDLVMADYSVSKLHARVLLTAGEFGAVLDCGSTNGTFVDGAAVEEGGTHLTPGASVTFGRCPFVFAPPALLHHVLLSQIASSQEVGW